MAITENDVRAAAPANAPEDVIKWVAEVAAITTPDKIEFSDGSQAEWERLTEMMVSTGMFTQLFPGAFPAFRRGSRGIPHLYLLRKGRGRRSHQPLV